MAVEREGAQALCQPPCHNTDHSPIALDPHYGPCGGGYLPVKFHVRLSRPLLSGSSKAAQTLEASESKVEKYAKSCEEISERSLTLEAVDKVVEKEMPDKVLEEVGWFCRRYATQNFPSADVEASDLALRGKYQNDMSCTARPAVYQFLYTPGDQHKMYDGSQTRESRDFKSQPFRFRRESRVEVRMNVHVLHQALEMWFETGKSHVPFGIS
ncbi:hypothetical protein B0H14DRAFT_3138698 [Mycena olivaceomarginata]|nr:hypothetical protein B0H14DRAFT_3138698 [Mycena olivaceomarginata]